MSDDEADPSLLALLRQSLGLGTPPTPPPPTTNVLSSASYIVDNAIDVALSAAATKAAAHSIHAQMRARNYSTDTWSAHELHPKPEAGESSLDFIFTMDLLNFSFWVDEGSGKGRGSGSEEERVKVVYRGQEREGYWALLACLWRALDEGE